jgi:Uncharacterised nucleotidyltransferase
MERNHELLLRACFGRNEDSRLALDACERIALDPSMVRLLPFVYNRWKGFATSSLIETGQRAYLATWRQNRERMTALRDVLTGLKQTGIECMVLKGAALTLRHYRDYGLRNMGDFDILVHPWDTDRAINFMLRNGWVAEGGCTSESIIRQSRVRHAWQFSRGETEHCDLHWRPLSHCNSPVIREMFWQGAEMTDLNGLPINVPGPTDLFFHVCVHAMHWEWTPNLYWFADALVLLGQGQVDWGRAGKLARASQMTGRFIEALRGLRSRFGVSTVEPRCADSWEQREFALLQKPCPLALPDRIAWHRYHFRRLRPFDPGWKQAPYWAAFPDYLRTFLDGKSWPDLFGKLWKEVR